MKIIEDYTENFLDLVKLYSPDVALDRTLQFNIK